MDTAMKRYLALLLLLVSTGALLHAQDAAPAVLFDATQCLVNDKSPWVNVTGLQTLQLAYHQDAKTFGGAKYLYVIVFTSPKRDQGKVFDIRLKDHRTYSIENNASFAVTPTAVTFPEPPLGGSWTQSQLTTSIQSILHHHRWYEVEVKYLRKPNSKVHCEAAVEDMVNPK